LCDRSAVLYFAPLDVLLIAKEEGSSATDSVTDVTDVRKKEEGRRKKEEGRKKKEEGRGNW
jgi:hypothetical protein